jgi:hypothetical protein
MLSGWEIGNFLGVLPFKIEAMTQRVGAPASCGQVVSRFLCKRDYRFH